MAFKSLFAIVDVTDFDNVLKVTPSALRNEGHSCSQNLLYIKDTTIIDLYIITT